MSDARDDIDPDATGEGADLGSADPITGVPNGDGDLDDEAGCPTTRTTTSPAATRWRCAPSRWTRSRTTRSRATPSLPGPGDGNDGPTGGAPAESEPILPRQRAAGEDIDLDDEDA